MGRKKGYAYARALYKNSEDEKSTVSLKAQVVSTGILMLGHFIGCARVMPKTSSKTSMKGHGQEHGQEHNSACTRNCVFKPKVRFLKGMFFLFLERKVKTDIGII